MAFTNTYILQAIGPSQAQSISATVLGALLSGLVTPAAHASTHKSAGSDPIKLDELKAPDDNTTLDASTTKHGLLLKGSGAGTTYLRDDCSWAAISAAHITTGNLPAAQLPNGGVHTGDAVGTFPTVTLNTVTVGKGGTGLTTLTAHAIQIGNGTSNVTQLAVGGAGQILTGAASADPAWTSTPTLGASGTLGTITFGNATSGTILLTPAAGALGTVTLTMPAVSGTILQTGTTVTVAQGGTGLATLTAHALQVGNGTGTITQIAVPTEDGKMLQCNNAADPTWTATPTLGKAGTTKGTITLAGNTSGTCVLQPTAAAGGVTITFPATTGTVITTGDSGTVTSTMIADATIVDADISGSAAIAGSKLVAATGSVAGAVTTSAQTFAGAKTFTNGFVSGNSAASGTGYTSNATNDNIYEEGTLATTLTNFNATPPSITIKLVRRGALVMAQIVTAVTEASKSNANNPALTNNFPAGFRPAQTVNCMAYIKNNGAFSLSLVQISSAGAVTFLADASGNSWTASAAAAIQAFSFSFQIN